MRPVTWGGGVAARTVPWKGHGYDGPDSAMTSSEPPERQDAASYLSSDQFYAAAGVEDWRVLWGGGYACACFLTGAFGTGVALVQAIGELAAAAGHFPDVDLRPEGVTVRLATGEPGGLSSRDVDLARRISAIARELQVAADPAVVQHVQVAIDALDIARVRPFWHAVLGYDEVEDADLLDRHRRGPSFWFQQMDAERPQRNRIHIDLYVPHDQVQARIAAGLAAGGTLVNGDHAPRWWTLADPEGNEVDLAIWG
jgi:4a-hydroxytetrahydrobiopterin dehydratase